MEKKEKEKKSNNCAQTNATCCEDCKSGVCVWAWVHNDHELAHICTSMHLV